MEKSECAAGDEGGRNGKRPPSDSANGHTCPPLDTRTPSTLGRSGERAEGRLTPLAYSKGRPNWRRRVYSLVRVMPRAAAARALLPLARSRAARMARFSTSAGD